MALWGVGERVRAKGRGVDTIIAAFERGFEVSELCV